MTPLRCDGCIRIRYCSLGELIVRCSVVISIRADDKFDGCSFEFVQSLISVCRVVAIETAARLHATGFVSFAKGSLKHGWSDSITKFVVVDLLYVWPAVSSQTERLIRIGSFKGVENIDQILSARGFVYTGSERFAVRLIDCSLKGSIEFLSLLWLGGSLFELIFESARVNWICLYYA